MLILFSISLARTSPKQVKSQHGSYYLLSKNAPFNYALQYTCDSRGKEKENTGSKLTHSCLPNLVANRLRDTGMRHTTSME